ncbi:MAG: quinone-dependent dihydroorotate dehydrogenase [Deltaproteobacteria bacterium]|nr:quinone-dependent dihydroorotate dehydrogenase [Deltaproteobacteria bacterium]
MTSSTLFWKTLRSVLFCLEAEEAHRRAVQLLSVWSRFCSVELKNADIARHDKLRRSFLGLEFPNPLGLAAGFDKDAQAVPAWQALGFGFVEVGTVTAKPQIGNPKPRLFRLPKDGALLNCLGFNNEGARRVAERVAEWRRCGKVRVPLGINLGKSMMVPLEGASADYLESFTLMADVADYIVINVSSPNTPGLRDLQQEERLKELLDVLVNANQKRQNPKPLLLKLSPDLPDEALLFCGKISLERGLAGLIVTNTTVSHEGLQAPVPLGPGGISGRPLFSKSTAQLKLLRGHFRDKMVLIGVGGVMDPVSALEKMRAGADLIQTYTGFVYGGPGFPRRILNRLLRN